MNYKIKKDYVQLLNDNKNIGNFQNESSVGTHKNSDNINLPSVIYSSNTQHRIKSANIYTNKSRRPFKIFKFN